MVAARVGVPVSVAVGVNIGNVADGVGTEDPAVATRALREANDAVD